jgi:hypothetical protein
VSDEVNETIQTTEEGAQALRADLRAYHERLLAGVRELDAGIENDDLTLQIEIGSILRDVSDAFGGLLDKIKEKVREHAVRRTGGRAGTCLLEGNDLGEATVNIPEASLRLTRDKSIEELRRALGGDFDLFFEEVTTHRPRKDFEARVAVLQDTSSKKTLLASVERVEATPRVGFKRGDANKPEHDG